VVVAIESYKTACLIAPVVTNTSIILSCNKIQNGDILVLANPGLSGEWLLKRRKIFQVRLSVSVQATDWKDSSPNVNGVVKCNSVTVVVCRWQHCVVCFVTRPCSTAVRITGHK